MDVRLLSYTASPEQVVATAARTCYSAKNPNKIWEDMESAAKTRQTISIIRDSGHESPIEHVSFTFAITGVSRVLLAQITRHRLASFSVQSQRYVTYSDSLHVVEPPSLEEDSDASKTYADAMANSCSSYKALIERGIPPEDARFVLTESTCTNMVVTMNARELKHFFSLRCCNRAQWEIRALAEAMFRLVYPVAPNIFLDAGPSCVAMGRCPEGAKTCGHMQDVKQRYNAIKGCTTA